MSSTPKSDSSGGERIVRVFVEVEAVLLTSNGDERELYDLDENVVRQAVVDSVGHRPDPKLRFLPGSELEWTVCDVHTLGAKAAA